jgi:hypothetical protein
MNSGETMNKFTTLLTIAAILSGPALSAQTVAAGTCPANSFCGKKEITQPAPCPKKEFAWGVGICGLLVVGAVTGITVAMATQSN